PDELSARYGGEDAPVVPQGARAERAGTDHACALGAGARVADRDSQWAPRVRHHGSGENVTFCHSERSEESAARLRSQQMAIGVARAMRALLLLSPRKQVSLRWPRGAGARVKRARLQICFCERQRADPSSLRSSG